MIRGRRLVAVAVRRPQGDIALRLESLDGLYTGRVRRIPFVRGIIVLWETLALGTKALLFSSNVALGEEEKEISRPVLWGTVLLALTFVIAIIFVGPVLLTGRLEGALDNERLAALVEGIIRLGVLLAYIFLIGLLPDIRRVFAYHGAEHKTIHALEDGAPLEVETVRRYSTAHPRCGTSFLLVVVVISVLLFVLVGSPPLWQRLLSRVVLVPVIAAVSYEVIRLMGALQANRVMRILFRPNLWLQSLTTREPDDAQVEVAIYALREVLAADKTAEATAASGQA
ncbi:MAG: DUF1385 domain-containing protein [Dehalococcoidia bacterium]|nr:MAG: DUF1385 domain-containing protein [Dehalococcoidia bacterium]